jgi:hypothetical protein
MFLDKLIAANLPKEYPDFMKLKRITIFRDNKNSPPVPIQS